MTPDRIQPYFTRSDGTYVFARWGRPIAPVVFGVDDATLGVVKAAFQAIASLTTHDLAQTDPELGANCMVFFVRDWAELSGVPDLDKLVPDLASLLPRLTEAGANQYRVFRFDETGAIKAAFVFLRMDDDLSRMPAEDLALGQAVQTILLWSDTAFTDVSPLAIHPETGATILRPEIADLIRAAYDPVMPGASRDASHALRLSARLQGGGNA